MKSKTYITILLISALIVISNTMSSQDANLSNLQQKYWVYRNRFFDQFIAARLNPPTSIPDYGIKGTNIPSDIRHLDKSSSSATDANKQTWGDGTIYLSQYISVLATEYKLFKDNQQYQELSDAKTLEYLVAALNAFNRLDATAESYYRADHSSILFYNGSGNGSDDMNGFYIRDDVPENFLRDLPFIDFSDHLKTDGTINSVQSDFTGAPPSYSIYQKECSQDQGWHMLLSLALVKECVGTTETGNFFYFGNRTIRWMVQNIAARIVKAMQSYIIAMDPSTGSEVYYDEWILRNPITQQNVSVHRTGAGDITETPEWALASSYTAWGLPASYGGMAYAFGEAGTRISGIDCHFNNSENQKWQFKAGLNVIGGWYTSTELHNGYNHYCLATIIGGVLENSNDETFKYLLKIVKASGYVGYHENLPLIFAILHGQTDVHTEIIDLKQFCINMLNSAPDCGPYLYGSGEYGNYLWTSTNRLYGAQNLLQNNSSGGFKGDYNGLDYLLLHNLYRLVYIDKKIPLNVIVADNSPHDVIDYGYIGSLQFPIGTHTVGNDASPETIKARNLIESDKTVNSDGNLTLIAGNIVHLKPGFHAMAGSKFHAYIDNGLLFHQFTDLDLCPGVNIAGRLMHDTTVTDNPFNLTENLETKLILAGADTNQQDYFTINSTENETIQNNVKTETYTNTQQQEKNSNITNTSKPYSVSVYPNPSTGKFLIEINSSAPANTTVELRDLLGKTIYSSSILQNSSSIDITTSPAGIYFITVCVGKDCWVGKVVKE